MDNKKIIMSFFVALIAFLGAILFLSFDKNFNSGLEVEWVYNGSDKGLNFTVTLANNRSHVNISCFQQYMELSEPDGQDFDSGIFTVLNSGNETMWNITLNVTNELPENLTIFAQTSNYVHPGSIFLNESPKIVIKRIEENRTMNVWLFANCSKVDNNWNTTINYTFGGGVGSD